MNKRIFSMLLLCGLVVFRAYAAGEKDVPSVSGRILNLWCEAKIMGNRSFDLADQVKKVVNGEEVPVFNSWDLFVKHVGLAQKDPKNPSRVRFGALYVLSESRRRACAYLMELASAQMVPVLGGIQNESDARLKRNVGYGDRFRTVLGMLRNAREMMDSGQELLDQKPDRKDFQRLKQSMVDEIALYEDLVAASLDRVYAWGNPRDDRKKKKQAEKDYAEAQRRYETEIERIRTDIVEERFELLKKHGLEESLLAHGGDLIDRYAARLIKSEKQYEEKY